MPLNCSLETNEDVDYKIEMQTSKRHLGKILRIYKEKLIAYTTYLPEIEDLIKKTRKAKIKWQW